MKFASGIIAGWWGLAWAAPKHAGGDHRGENLSQTLANAMEGGDAWTYGQGPGPWNGGGYVNAGGRYGGYFQPRPERVREFAPVGQSASLNPWLWFSMMKSRDNDKMAMLLPMIMARQSSEVVGGSQIGNDLMSNPLFFLALMDEVDGPNDCAGKYGITDTAKANPTIEADTVMSEYDFKAIDYRYIGCVEFEAEEEDDDLLFPLLMQGMNGRGGEIDPAMTLMMSGEHRAQKLMLPLMMMGGRGGNGGNGFDPAVLMMLLEETACELKFDVPKRHYVRAVDGKVTVVSDVALVKDFFKSEIADYKSCVEGGDSGDSDDDLLFWMMMMGM